MNNNIVLRRLRYIYDINDDGMIRIFASGGIEASRAEISAWLKKDDDEDFDSLYDIKLAAFLNGFINEKRGKREGEQPKPEKTLSNNLVLKKLKIALNLRNEHILEIMELADLQMSEHELSALLRKPGTRQYRTCKDQFLRNFLMGLQLKFRPE